MSKYIKGQQILDTYDIEGFKLLDYIKRGLLHPYNGISGNPEPPPYISAILQKKEKARLEWQEIIKGHGPIEEGYKTDNKWDKPLEPVSIEDIEGPWVITQLMREYPGCDTSEGVFRTKDGYYIPFDVMERLWKLDQDLLWYEEELSKFKDGKYTWKEYTIPPSQEGIKGTVNILINSLFLREEVSKVLGVIEEVLPLGPLNDSTTGHEPLEDSTQKLIESTPEKLRPNQRHRIECRKIAEMLLGLDPKMTIPELHENDKIKKACEGKKYHLETFRKWLKGLNYNNNPGRRRKKV